MTGLFHALGVRIELMEPNPYESPRSIPTTVKPASKWPSELYRGHYFGCLVQVCAIATMGVLTIVPWDDESEIAIGLVALLMLTIPGVVCAVVLYRRHQQSKTAAE